ncbi:hypothetical protein EUGRSUZ_E01437 [Eucalyptus grandis]|uniref:Uncharacterized protein n=2 Tax=Eucalyptus grandis TaxID=71139 RepID=A0ACC3KUM9_EUCGR|nr:hypothetical protein EUGRSUZ_E01437 [Eucalyptus grandis]
MAPLNMSSILYLYSKPASTSFLDDRRGNLGPFNSFKDLQRFEKLCFQSKNRNNLLHHEIGYIRTYSGEETWTSPRWSSWPRYKCTAPWCRGAGRGRCLLSPSHLHARKILREEESTHSRSLLISNEVNLRFEILCIIEMKINVWMDRL